MTTTKIADFIQSIIEKRPGDSKELFNSIMSEKVLYKMAEKRHDMAKTLFRGLNEEKEWVLVKGSEKPEDTNGPSFKTKEDAEKFKKENAKYSTFQCKERDKK